MYLPINAIGQNDGVSQMAKKARNEQHNKTPGRKVAQRECKKINRELKKIALNQESIVMENPNYLPDSTSFNVDVDGPRGSILTHHRTIPEVNGTPVYSESTSDQRPNMRPVICLYTKLVDIMSCMEKDIHY